MIADFVLDLAKDLVLEIVKSGLNYATQDPFKQRRIRNRVEDAVSTVIQPLVAYLVKEGLSEEQQRLLFETCVIELKPFAEKPAELFRGSLDGQKLFERANANGLPEAIRHERIEGVYEMVFPRIASLVCELPLGLESSTPSDAISPSTGCVSSRPARSRARSSSPRAR